LYLLMFFYRREQREQRNFARITIMMHTGYSLSPGSHRLAYISKILRALRVLRASFFLVSKKAATETGAGIDSFPTTSRRDEHGSTPFNYTCPAMTTTPSFYQHPVAYGTSAPIEHPKPALGTFL
jgi:hypothetical protein